MHEPVCAGAFHPKLVVLVGDDDVWAAIGSGNPTWSGWGHNQELWLVLRTSTRRGPNAQRDLAAWLVDLPEVVAMPTWIADAVVRVGGYVAPDEVDDSLPDLRIFGNLRQPILRQLSTGPVDALRVSSPYFDPRGAALLALVDRFSAAALDVALQPTLSQYDAAALAQVARPCRRPASGCSTRAAPITANSWSGLSTGPPRRWWAARAAQRPRC